MISSLHISHSNSSFNNNHQRLAIFRISKKKEIWKNINCKKPANLHQKNHRRWSIFISFFRCKIVNFWEKKIEIISIIMNFLQNIFYSTKWKMMRLKIEGKKSSPLDFKYLRLISGKMRNLKSLKIKWKCGKIFKYSILHKMIHRSYKGRY